MNGEVAAGIGAITCNLGAASLTDENFAGADFLATETLNAEALPWAVVNVFACTACFDV